MEKAQISSLSINLSCIESVEETRPARPAQPGFVQPASRENKIQQKNIFI